MKYFLFLFPFFLWGCQNTGVQKESPLPRKSPPLMQEKKDDQVFQKYYTLKEISQHNTQDDCWTVIDGNVANVTSFFGTHPGGDINLQKACGKDATQIFQSVQKHDPNGYAALKRFTIGKLRQ